MSFFFVYVFREFFKRLGTQLCLEKIDAKICFNERIEKYLTAFIFIRDEYKTFIEFDFRIQVKGLADFQVIPNQNLGPYFSFAAQLKLPLDE